jgi:F-type H+-transporting ATPase subunit c
LEQEWPRLEFLVQVINFEITQFLIYSQIYFSTGVGIGIVFGQLMQSYARNPSLKQQLFSYAILGFALSEAMGLFSLMIAFLLLFAF